MKEEKSSSFPPATHAGEGHAGAPATKPAGNTQSFGAIVHLGTSIKQLRSREGSVANSPLVNAAKIAEIKQAISEGRFKVNPCLVADRLISTVADLIRPHKA